MPRRVCVIGLDCLAPELLFGELHGALPAFAGLAAAGLAGRLASTIPAVTVPAWSAMVTGVDPGVLGCYGFRDRADRGYTRRRLASSLDVREPTLWTHVGRAGGRSRIITVPQTHPPRPLSGCLVSDHPLRDGGPTTHPPEIEEEVRRLAGGDLAEAAPHRTLTLETLRRAVYESTTRRFRLARAWAAEADWSLLMMVDMGPDRMHHAFWRFSAPDHPAHVAGHPLAGAIRDYYAFLDSELQALLANLRADDVVLVVSDHGARTMRGGIALNQWLADAGYLALKRRPTTPTAFDRLEIDWPRTRAWADGGYVGRVYFNVAGREPEGAVPAAAIPALTRELCDGLLDLTGPGGEVLQTRVVTPAEAYREVRGIAPDLLVELDDLAYRALGSVGHPALHVSGNDTGRDDANHAREGVILLRDGRGSRRQNASIYDVAPTVLDRLGLPVPPSMRGQVLA